jgi:hypothetical protein
LEQNDQSIIIFTAAAAILVQLLSGDKSIDYHDIHLTTVLVWMLYFVYILAFSLMIFRYHISSKEKLSHKYKMIFMFLNLLTGTAPIAANIVFLAMVDKSYLVFASIPFLGLILVAVLFYIVHTSDQNLETPGENKENESMVKNSFQVGNAATTIGYAVETAVIVCCLQNPASSKIHPQYSLTLPFLTSVLGSFAMTIASSPLKFQGDLMCTLLKNIPNVLLVFLGLVAAFFAGMFMDPTKEVFAVVISFVNFLVILCQKSSKKQVFGREANPLFGVISGFGIPILATIYSTKFGSEGCDSCLTYPAFFLLLAIISSLMRMAFPFHPADTFIQQMSDALPVVYILAGLALLPTKILTFVAAIGVNVSAGKPIPPH